MKRPNFLIILVDEQRYPPIYENEQIRTWIKTKFRSEDFLKQHGLEFYNHYVGSTACSPSRGTLYTGQYPSLHGVSQTPGVAKGDFDPDMFWLDPNTVPTIGDYLRANGYNTYWRGKWHVSQPDIIIPNTHDSLLSYNDLTGISNIKNTNIYKNANRLDKYGFNGWIGPEPFGTNSRNTGSSSSGDISGRDTVYAKEVSDLINELNNKHQEYPWAIVASFVNPHDIAFYGEVSRLLPQFDFKIDPFTPYIPPAPTAKENLNTKPRAQKSYKEVFQKSFQPTLDTEEYRKLYYSLQLQVDKDIEKVLDSVVKSKFYENTIIIFTSDHGELLGAHGLFQKWYNAYEETIHVPFIIHNPRLFPKRRCTELLTSHIDILPTILGLANINEEKTLEILKKDHIEVQPLVGRDLTPLIFGKCKQMQQEPIYFMTDDNVTKGLNQVTLFGDSYTSVISPNNIEAVIAYLDTGKNGTKEKWKLSKYYDNQQFWTSPGVSDKNLIKTANEDFNSVSYFSIKREPDEAEYEMYNITRDPLEMFNLANNSQQNAKLTNIKEYLIILLYEQCKIKRLHPSSGRIKGKSEYQ
ncbi:sulfatase-like hydrolase/transferase [Clostridium sp.]|uniref:sulfatase-like hydrolase/transferase n=1 Tax=Clostridium sp. TaxID=1506 RepID=UPI00283E7C91|nr:sulfatase-like hydrolase/transferase [Clostridium sp.]MDR3596225.1 sulfatase-like hydrolase/transferase [Clostridium sp.]